MSVAANQQRTFLRLLAQVRPHWRHDAGLPARIQSLLARHREFGARDRRLYRELIYTTLRYLPWIEPFLEGEPSEAVRRVAWLAAETTATQAFRAAHATGERPGGVLADLLPGWFQPHCPEIFHGAELEAQLRRAPLWLRLQTAQPQQVLAEFAARGWPWRSSAILPTAVEMLAEADITKSDAWRDGHVEVQDLGSQLILASIAIEPGMRWLDACAGAGGKTLQLARLVGPSGHVAAFDVRGAALGELHVRVERARKAQEKCHLLDDNPRGAIRIYERLPTETFDGVLVDAPCSGSGTWRRSPHLKWITTEAHVEAASAKQQDLLAAFSARVKRGGRLVYATCSLSSRENESVVAEFLATHSEFQPEPFAETFGFAAQGCGLRILPARHDTDGFFVASLRRK